MLDACVGFNQVWFNGSILACHLIKKESKDWLGIKEHGGACDEKLVIDRDYW